MLDQQPQIALEPLAPAAALTEELAAQSAAQAGRCAAQLLLLRAAAGPAAAAVLGRPPASPALLPAQAPHCFAPLLHAPKAPAQSHAKPSNQGPLRRNKNGRRKTKFQHTKNHTGNKNHSQNR